MRPGTPIAVPLDMTRSNRLAILSLARAASARGDHAAARALFASVGISYVAAVNN